jgi:hypothetical protein
VISDAFADGRGSEADMDWVARGGYLSHGTFDKEAPMLERATAMQITRFPNRPSEKAMRSRR